MKTPGPKPLPLRFDPTDDSATKPAVILYDPPEDGASPYIFRWWGARYLLSADICAAIIDVMTPLQLLIVHYRLLGLTDDDISLTLNISRGALRQHLTRLRKRIYEQVPCIRSTLRNHYHYQPPPP